MGKERYVLEPDKGVRFKCIFRYLQPLVKNAKSHQSTPNTLFGAYKDFGITVEDIDNNNESKKFISKE